MKTGTLSRKIIKNMVHDALFDLSQGKGVEIVDNGFLLSVSVTLNEDANQIVAVNFTMVDLNRATDVKQKSVPVTSLKYVFDSLCSWILAERACIVPQ